MLMALFGSSVVLVLAVVLAATVLLLLLLVMQVTVSCCREKRCGGQHGHCHSGGGVGSDGDVGTVVGDESDS